MSETCSATGSKMFSRYNSLKIKSKNYIKINLNNYSSFGENNFIRFLLAGMANTLFGLVIYSFFILIGAEVWLALLIGTVSGIFFNFITFGGYVFRQLAPHRFPSFIIFYILVYFANFISIEFLLIWFHSEILIQCFLIAPMGIFSYLLMSNFVFTEK